MKHVSILVSAWRYAAAILRSQGHFPALDFVEIGPEQAAALHRREGLRFG